MTKITYSIETLYHLHCHNCVSYFNLSDKLPARVTCTHCGLEAAPEKGAESALLSIAGGLAARAIEDALSRGLTVEIPSLGIRISKDGIREKSSRGDSFLTKPNASETSTD